MTGVPDGCDFDGWVAQLGRQGRRRDARLHLRSVGSPALPALRRGLHHPKPAVRQQCASILDQLVDEDSLPDLIAALDDDDPGVLTRALHALACDQCKESECRPHDDDWVPRAMAFAVDHDDPDVRAKAIDALGRVVMRVPRAADVIARAAERDPDAGVRNIAHIRLRRLETLQARQS
ncbi:MAG: HEAT repeat domain-containing protein [Acidimicrobiales bacterium]